MRDLINVLLFTVISASAFAQNNEMTVASSAFKNNGIIPKTYSCEGTRISPPLHISNIPKGTPFIAIIIHDPDAPFAHGFTHWLAWNIPTNMRTEMDIPENFTGGDHGLNSTNTKGYASICPQSGTHRYHFYVYAQTVKVEAGNKTDKMNLESRLEGHYSAKATLIGLYTKAK